MPSLLPLERDWNFRRLDTGGRTGAEEWTRVDLPHCPFVADPDGHNHWFGLCEYSRALRVDPPAPGSRLVLHVDAAMHTAGVLVDGVELARHEGGYLPFEADLTGALAGGAEHTITLRLDNRENPDVPPGKPFGELDFCWYGGLYQGVRLITRPPVHITDPNSAGEVAGGGVFIRTLEASPEHAVVRVKTHVRNTGATAQPLRVDVHLLHKGREAASAASPEFLLGPGSATHVELDLPLASPALWSPASPALYDARVVVRDATGSVLDRTTVRCGIRRIAFSRSGGFTVNGRRLRLRGTNRHQEMPGAGYAAPRAAQYRDARRIKEAGFDYVRLSHYPQSPHFLDACDELGIVVMNAIPGWQFLGGERFREACYENARQLVRRDRNHPCVVLWELSLNETAMDEDFMARLHAIGHEEYPGGQMFTCGWIDRYDVFIHSRQHGRIHTWSNGDKALVIAEYGDWEFYAANEGFNQTTGAGVLAASGNARKFRGDGERGLRRQAANHALALSDCLSSPAGLNGQWAMFDYARGYHPVRAGAGVMDSWRLAKFSYHLYRSQRDASEGGPGWTGGPVVFIASHWTPASSLEVTVFSNCEEVELRLNGRPVERRKPERDWAAQHLPHPPFVFALRRFVRGTLEAIGYIGGREQARHAVTTPGRPLRLALEVDTLGIAPAADEPDVVFAHARILDGKGALCVDKAPKVTFAVEGGAEIVGPATVRAEAGIASIVLRIPPGLKEYTLKASSKGLQDHGTSLDKVISNPGFRLDEPDGEATHIL